MVTHEITFRILLTPLRIRLALPALFLAAFPRMAATADVAALESYYPPPSGTHAALMVTGTTSLGRDQESVILGSKYNGNTHVGVAGPTDSDFRLRVHGDMRVDGCIWLQRTDDKYRCRWEPP